MSNPELIPQRHGGALLSGGVPGHRGAGGRPSTREREEAKEAMGKDVVLRLKWLAQGIAFTRNERGKTMFPVYPSQRVKAAQALARLTIPHDTDATELMECVCIAAAEFIYAMDMPHFVARVEAIREARTSGETTEKHR